MTTTLDSLRGQINRRTGHYLTDEALTDLINESLTALSLEARWPWLDAAFALTWPDDDSTSTTMPWSWQVIKAVTVNETTEYRPRAQRDVETYTTGSPGWTFGFAVHGRVITLAPAPPAGQVVRVLGTRHEPALAGATDEPLLPDEYVPAVVHHACATVFDRHHDAARRATHMREFDEWVKRMKRAVRDQAQGPRVPRVRPGSGI